MSAISTWSTTAASNNSASPNGWPEDMAPSGVNDSARENMAQIRTWYENTEWRDWGHTPTRTGNTTFTVPTDQTAVYTANRPIRCTDSSTIYGYIVSSAFTTVTTVTISSDSGNLSASLTAVAVGPDPTTQSIPIQGVRHKNWTDFPVLISKDVSVNSISSSVAETTVFTYTVPASTLDANSALRITMHADFTSTSTHTWTIKMKYGATTLTTQSIAFGAVTDSPIEFVGHMYNDGATNSQKAVSRIIKEALATGITQNLTSAEDSTTALAFAITLQASNTALSANVHGVFLELLP